MGEVTPPPQIIEKKRPRKKRTSIRRFFFALLLIIACGGAAYGGYYLAHQQFGPEGAPLFSEQDGNQYISEDEETIERVSRSVAPSVVSIVTSGSSGSGIFAAPSQGAGTGIVVSQDGYVMTNRHVVQNASNIAVVAHDGTRHTDVEVVGSDPLNDIAFIKIDNVDDLEPATLGNSGSVRIGQRVIAIGNALGQYQNSVTSGIVSGTGRPVVASGGSGQTEQLNDLIQTDAAINSGNSGGPLLNSAGQVIGINTAVATDATGVGFAIPINATKGMVEGLLETGRVERAYIGVQFIDITPEVARAEDLSVDRGAYVTTQQGSAVVNGSPADEAGIEDGDIITHVNEDAVGETGSLGSLISQYRPDQEITLTVVRDGSEQEITLTLASYDD